MFKLIPIMLFWFTSCATVKYPKNLGQELEAGKNYAVFAYDVSSTRSDKVEFSGLLRLARRKTSAKTCELFFRRDNNHYFVNINIEQKNKLQLYTFELPSGLYELFSIKCDGEKSQFAYRSKMFLVLKDHINYFGHFSLKFHGEGISFHEHILEKKSPELEKMISELNKDNGMKIYQKDDTIRSILLRKTKK